MGHTANVLDDVRTQVAPSDQTLAVARERRRAVIDAAKAYPGFLRSYMLGSIAHGTANGDTDADCGIVLDRRSYPKLGPDGDGDGPSDTVESMRGHLREALSEDYDGLSFRVTKRAIMVTFNDPVAEGVDPHVDLIVAINRKDEPGLWIPNTERNGWDASDPEAHTSLLTSGERSRRTARARVVRLAKAWNNQYSQPGLCSFNIEALALAALDGERDLAQGLATLFSMRHPTSASTSRPILQAFLRQSSSSWIAMSSLGAWTRCRHTWPRRWSPTRMMIRTPSWMNSPTSSGTTSTLQAPAIRRRLWRSAFAATPRSALRVEGLSGPRKRSSR